MFVHPGAVLTLPDLYMQHQIKQPLRRPRVVVSGYEMQQTQMQTCTRTHEITPRHHIL